MRKKKITIIEGKHHFVFRDFVTSERKLKIEKHPQALTHFRFTKHYAGWKWYVRTETGSRIVRKDAEGDLHL